MIGGDHNIVDNLLVCLYTGADLKGATGATAPPDRELKLAGAGLQISSMSYIYPIMYQLRSHLKEQSNLLSSFKGGCHIKCYVNDSTVSDR